jgi:hypothetical protein
MSAGNVHTHPWSAELKRAVRRAGHSADHKEGDNCFWYQEQGGLCDCAHFCYFPDTWTGPIDPHGAEFIEMPFPYTPDNPPDFDLVYLQLMVLVP